MNIVSKLTNTEVTNTKTRDETAHHHVYPGLHRGDLNDVADDEKEDTKGQALAATPPIRCVCTRESTN